MADNKKIYTIQINGIDQSIKQVDALSDALQFLEKKIKELESRSVSITSSNSGGSSRNAELQTEDKLLKQIQQTEQQIRDARREDYQSLLAQKDLLKESKELQEQRAAAERLSTGNYDNTMKGMKKELSDLKKVFNTVDIGSDKFKEMTARASELTEKLKKIEETYGQFGRNVGNYKSAFDEMKKVTVQVGKTSREFNSVRDASRQLTQELKAMAIAGKEDTEEYKELAEAVHNFEMASKRAESAVNDLKASSKGMDDILDTFESLGYLASTTQGLSALFGFDNSSIERSIQKLVALQNVLQGIEKLRLKINASDAGIVGDLFKGGNQAVDSFVAKITGAQVGINGLTKSSKAATIAVRGLSTALKGLGIGIAMFAISKLIDGLSSLGDEMNSTEKVTNRLDEALKELNKGFEERNQTLMSSYLKNGISDEQFLSNLYQNQTEYLNEQIYLLKERAALMNKANEGGFFTFDFMDSFTKGGSFTGDMMGGSQTVSSYSFLSDLIPTLEVTAKDIKEVEEEWRKCNEAIKEGKDYFTKWGDGVSDFVNSLFASVSDTERVMIGLGNIDISNFIGSFAKVNEEFSKGTITAEEYAKEIGKLKDQLNSSDVLRSVIANLDKYIPDEKVREAINNIISDIVRLDDSFNMTSPAQIRHWTQVRIDGMKEGSAKIKAQLEADERYEIAQYGKTEEQINLIHQKYARKRIDDLKKYNEQEKNKAKQHAREIEAVEKELQSLRIQNMAEGLNKQLAQLEEERRQKLAKAKQDGIKVNELTVEINKLYDKKILDAKKEWAYNIEQVYINMWNKIYQINHQNAQMDFENQLKQIQSNYAKLQDMAAKNSNGVNADYSDKGVVVTKTPESKKKAGSSKAEDYDYEVLIEKDEAYTQRLRQEYATRTEDRKRYYQEIEQLSIQQLDEEYAVESQKAIENMNNELRTLQNGYKAQDHELETHLKKGEITREQYNEAVTRLEKERAENEAQIELKYHSESEQRERQHNQKIKEAKEQTNQAILNNYRQVMDKLNSVDSSEVVRNGIGFMNITATRRRNKELIDMYKQLSDDMANEMGNLKQKLNTEDLTKEQREQIEALINEYMKLQASIGQTMVNIQANSKAATQEFISECNMYFQEFAQSLQTVLSAIWDAQDAAFDREMDELDKSIDAAREKYQEMDELAQEHKSTMESLEEAIGSAQGDARDHLLDRYNAEIEAQRTALREKKKAEKEEEKLQAKKERMEKEQKERERNRNLITAAINAAMAISYAAVNTWPVPAIPMMAAAAVAGAAQIAAIAAQHYAQGGQLDGGVAQGKRHRDGGIKVLGGHAEIEGGEFVTNRVTTSKNIDLLEYINSKKKKININDLIEFYGGDSPVKKNIQAVRTKFADGGVIPTLRNDISVNDRMIQAMEDYSNRPVQVAVVDIIDRTEQVNNVKVMAGLDV